ncbi:hypothetical protein UK23_30890 [Lentzea aerocolonigenes]|uniref:Uncharacterized protein n=1 Tax=Lentzea aerocolonigenes TaxID=68170 RepID=A0A0F0GNA1_LENAE|nr:hypothetical protein [Lentzea aerocolonigenes]KJK44056.1 hypothetical protein UK23_30890 [Lentzea aerocolonigenes]
MDLLRFVLIFGVFFLIMGVLYSIVKAGQRSVLLRTVRAAAAAFQRQAGEPGWRLVPDEEDVPAGRISALERMRRAAVAGTRGGRTVRAAVFSSTEPAGHYQSVPFGEVTVLGLVVAVDVPELRGDLRMDPPRASWGYVTSGGLAPLVAGDAEKKVLARLKPNQPAVDIADGVACFTFTDMDLAGQVGELAGLACDVVDILVRSESSRRRPSR